MHRCIEWAGHISCTPHAAPSFFQHHLYVLKCSRPRHPKFHPHYHPPSHRPEPPRTCPSAESVDRAMSARIIIVDSSSEGRERRISTQCQNVPMPEPRPLAREHRDHSLFRRWPWCRPSALFARTYLVHRMQALGEHREVVGQKYVVVLLFHSDIQ